MKYVRVLNGYQDYHNFKTGSIGVVVGEKTYDEGVVYDLRIYSPEHKSEIWVSPIYLQV